MRIRLPKGKLAIRFSRSGGPGGQNVNKVETKVEVRLRLLDLDVPEAVRERLESRLAGRLDREGRISVASSRFRLRSHNMRDCIEKLESLLADASEPEAERVVTKPPRSSREKRRSDKRQRSLKKRDRRARGDDD